MANQQLNSLKTINSIQRDGSLQNLLLSIKEAKTQLDIFSKNLQEKKSEVQAKKREEERKIAEKPEVKAEEISSQTEEKVVEEKKVEVKDKPQFVSNRQNGNYRKFDQKTQPQNSNKNFQNKPNTNKPQFNKPQFNKNQPSKDAKNKSFVSTKANNYKSFAPAETTNVQAQPERNFGNKNKRRVNVDESRKVTARQKQMQERHNNASNNIYVLDDEGFEETTMGSRKLIKKKNETPVVVAPKITHAVLTSQEISIKDLSEKIGKPVAEIVKKCMLLGIMATINSTIDFDTCELICSDFGITLELKLDKSYEEKLIDASTDDDEKDLVKRPPVVTVMGHVDHGKTSLLDAFRRTNVVSGEAGGITQKIGAYQITFNNEKITFIDTPGHAAFTAMRARGAEVTDIAILVVAADDGIMPQTVEAINHIKAAKVPMIVAINKMDKPEANPDRVKQQLTEYGILPEEWGGDAICIPISAKTGMGLDELKKMILLVAEMEDLKANPNRKATGVVIEAELDKARGPVATVLVQNGTLKIGDSIICGITYGKVKAMFDENGKAVKKATPSTPVAVMGFNEVPSAGDQVFAVEDSLSKQVIHERIDKIKKERAKQTSGVSADDFMSRIHEGNLKSLNIIIKADTQGSVEALRNSLEAIRNEEVKVVTIHSGAGAITESDLILAQTTNSVVIAFNIKIPAKTEQLADSLKVQIIESKIIYEVVDQITRLSKGMMAIKYEEKYIGTAEIRQVFKLSSAGKIAGSYVTDGKIQRNAIAKIKRNGEIVCETTVESLKIVKDEKSEVARGFECGVKFKDNFDIQEGDIVEYYVKEEVKRD